MVKAIKIDFNINIGDFCELFPPYLLDCIRMLNIYEIDTDSSSAYYFGDSDELKKLVDIFEFTHIIEGMRDVTKLFYTNQLPFTSVDIEFLNEFLIKNVTPDDVLDKIWKYGVDTLTPLDETILNKV